MSTLSSTTKGRGKRGESPAAIPAATAAARKPTRPPLHPGSVISETLEILGINAFTASKAIGVSAATLTNVINGKSGVSADMALRIGKYFGNGPRIWLDLQATYDLWHRGVALKDELAAIQTVKSR